MSLFAFGTTPGRPALCGVAEAAGNGRAIRQVKNSSGAGGKTVDSAQYESVAILTALPARGLCPTARAGVLGLSHTFFAERTLQQAVQRERPPRG